MTQPQSFLSAPQPGAYHPPATPLSQTEDAQAVYALTPYDDRNVSAGEIAEYLHQVRLEERGNCI